MMSTGSEDTSHGQGKPERLRQVDRLLDRVALTDHPLLGVWVATTAIVFGLCAVWSLATPIGATNDEGSQVMRAVSVVRGELLGTALTPVTERSLTKDQLAVFTACESYLRGAIHVVGTVGANRCASAFTVVTVPQAFSHFLPSMPCNSLPLAPDSCPTRLDGSDRPVSAITYVGRYPPLYYAVVGLPSLFTQTDAAIYAMRLVSGLLTAILIGLSVALVTTWSSRRFLLLAVTVAATPMLLVFGSTVNPGGLEMSAALCTWTGLLILALEHADKPPPGLVAACTAASTVLALSRALSVFWLVLVFIFVVALRPAAVRPLAADRWVRIGSVVVGAVVVVAVFYVLWAKSLNVLPVGSPVPAHASWSQLVQVALGRTSSFIFEFTGAFGWALANPPLGGIVLLVFAVCTVVLGGLVTGKGREALILAGLFVAAVALPLLIMVSQAGKDGIVWQAKDGFPLYCGVILVAGAIAAPRLQLRADPAFGSRVIRRLVVVVATCVTFSQLADLLWAIRRYTVGLWGPIDVFAHIRGSFSPPVPIAVLVAASFGLCTTYGWWIVRICGRIPSAGNYLDQDAEAPKTTRTPSRGAGELEPVAHLPTLMGSVPDPPGSALTQATHCLSQIGVLKVQNAPPTRSRSDFFNRAPAIER